MRVAFIGAGPGDPELITRKGARLLGEADVVVYAGSLVNPALLGLARPGTPAYDSAGMTLEEVLAVYEERRAEPGLIARLHTGDPAMYGAIQEQLDYCEASGIETEVVPGVSSVFAAAAALRRELTLPGLSQTLILTRAAGRTPVPEAERLSTLASHGATMAVFLSAGLLEGLVAELLPSYGPDAPVRVVHRASWPDERVISGTLADIAGKAAGLGGQAMILVGRVLDPGDEYERSRLYDPGFSHGRRSASRGSGSRGEAMPAKARGGP